MKPEDGDKVFLNHLRGVLDAGARQLEPDLVRQLQTARARALARPRRYAPWWAWLTAGGLATVAVAALVAVLWYPVSHPVLPGATPEELDIMATGDHLDLYENLDFFNWLAHEDQNQSS